MSHPIERPSEPATERALRARCEDISFTNWRIEIHCRVDTEDGAPRARTLELTLAHRTGPDDLYRLDEIPAEVGVELYHALLALDGSGHSDPAQGALEAISGILQHHNAGVDGPRRIAFAAATATTRSYFDGAYTVTYRPPSFGEILSGAPESTKDPPDRPNALRIILAEEAHAAATSAGSRSEHVTMLATDIDDMSPEHLAAAADALREAGALDVICITVAMKKGRIGTRVEVLCRDQDVDRLEALLFERTSTLGVRRTGVVRRALARDVRTVEVLGHDVRVKFAALPDGRLRAKPEYEDLRSVAQATGRSLQDVSTLARAATERS